MDFELLAFPAALLLLLTSAGLLLSRDWRLSIALLALQTLGVFTLTALSWPLEMAVVKLVAGWICGAALGMALLNAPVDPQEPAGLWLSAAFFRFLATGLVVLAIWSIAPRAAAWLPQVSLPQLLGGLVLMSMGVLHLGVTARTLRMVLSLLTILAGFEILYAALERSTLVAGLLAGVNLILALAGAYLLSIPEMEAE
jgi:hypothetical protein